MIHAARLSRRALLVAAASASALPARAAPATLRGKATQGGLLFARAGLRAVSAVIREPGS